ncbi:hypothetical protein NE562_00595 [Butyricicoccus faecihominis]|uniref:hypothetical protein n=1 Tax=Butyricicoccus faecihominis TaxID=1712515 RepID=UPI00247AD4EA|nr:hypothetical protein [Butyricicoccus faecihominis]MCQ5128139.1 hypothetical protein [Butyricicoccus faecihominis]
MKKSNKVYSRKKDPFDQGVHAIFVGNYEYDDGSQALIIWGKHIPDAITSMLSSSDTVAKVVEGKLNAKQLSVKKRKYCDLKSKIGYPDYRGIKSYYMDESELRESLMNLQKMLFSCGKDRKSAGDVLKLTTALLTGYVARGISSCVADEEIRMTELRAPILIIGNHEGRWDTLRKIVESLLVGSESKKSEKPPTLQMIGSHILCNPNRREHMDDFSSVEFTYEVTDTIFPDERTATEKLNLPIQYRDTMVLIYRKHVFGQLVSFIQRNRWATIVVYGSSSKSVLIDPVRIDFKRLHTSDLDWSQESIKALIQNFVVDFSEHWLDITQFRLVDFWKRAKKLVSVHNSVRGSQKIIGQQATWMYLMTTTLLLFTDFLKKMFTNMCVSDHEKISEWWETELISLLLPYSCEAPQCNVPLGERTLDIARDADDIVQEILKKLISPEFSAHLYFVPPKGLFDLVDPEDGGTKYWGYLRQHFDRYRKPSYFALQIRKDQMEEIGNQLFPSRCDWEELIQQLKKKMPPYLCFIRPESMPIDEMERAAKKTATALTFDIGKFDFLSKEGKKYLHNRFLGMEDKAAWVNASEAGIEQPDSVQNEEAADETSVFDEIEEL